MIGAPNLAILLFLTLIFLFISGIYFVPGPFYDWPGKGGGGGVHVLAVYMTGGSDVILWVENIHPQYFCWVKISVMWLQSVDQKIIHLNLRIFGGVRNRKLCRTTPPPFTYTASNSPHMRTYSSIQTEWEFGNNGFSRRSNTWEDPEKTLTASKVRKILANKQQTITTAPSLLPSTVYFFFAKLDYAKQ